MLNGNKFINNANGNSLPTGSQANGVKGVHLNGSSYVNGFINKNGSLNGMKKLGCNGSSKAFGNSSNKQSTNCESTLPDPKVVLYPPEKVCLGWRGKFRPGAGMVNLGNTCYLNATLQVCLVCDAFNILFNQCISGVFLSTSYDFITNLIFLSCF